MGQTVADETYRSLACIYSRQINHFVKVELGETSFVLYIFLEIKMHIF